MIKVLRSTNDNRLVFMCPACKCGHWFNDTWNFNGDMVNPTVTPSILTVGAFGKCHSFITDGKIQFLDDCEHDLKGQTVPLTAII